MSRSFLFLAVLVFISVAVVSSPQAEGSYFTCTYAGPNDNLSCISPENTSQYLVNSATHTADYQLTPGGGVCGGASHSCLNIYQRNRPSGAVWFRYGYTTAAVLCRDQETPTLGNYFNFDQPRFGVDAWWQSYDPGGTLTAYQVRAPCSSGPTADFVNNSTQGHYYTLDTLCAHAAAGNMLEAKPMPRGIPFWLAGCDLTSAPNVTLMFDAGTKIYGPTCEGGAAGICLNSAGVTLRGAGAVVGYNTASNINEIIYVHGYTGKNPVIEGSAGDYFAIDCAGLYGQALAGQAPNGILSGPGVNTVTLMHVAVRNCGGGGGQNHAIYFGWGTGSQGDTAYCEDLHDVIVQDAAGDTPAVKIDDTCGTAVGTVANVSIYCTVEGNPRNNCDENEPIDFQCGGWHLVRNSYFEMYGQPGNDDQWAFSKINWGSLGTHGCQSTAPQTDKVRFDRDIFVFDGHASYAEAYGGKLIVACGADAAGSTSTGHCNANKPRFASVCITNSQIIEDDDDFNALNALWAGPGVYVDSRCSGSGSDTNTYYRGRTGSIGAGRVLACSAANWSPGSGTKCAFPFVPRYLTEKENHDVLVAQAHVAGLCGHGTVDDPIRACSATSLK